METIVAQAIAQIGTFGLIMAGTIVTGVMFGLWMAGRVVLGGYRGSEMSNAEKAYARKYGKPTTPAKW